jgi:hypothetical protein
MFRKFTLGLIAAASLSAAALTPASAGGFHGGWNGGWHSGWHGGVGYYGTGLYVGGLTDDCIQQRVVNTRNGPRMRTVNVCAF